MKVKIFYPNKDGRISFTKQELEKLLDDVYNEGHKDGYDKGYSAARPYWYWTSPYYTTTTNTTPLNISYDSGEMPSDYTVITCEAHNDIGSTTTNASSSSTETTLNINLNDYINKVKSDSNTAHINFTV